MVISQATFGWGLLEVDVTIPVRWRAVAGGLASRHRRPASPRACVMATTRRLSTEIDLLETSGRHRSVDLCPWFDERLRSASTANDIPTIADVAPAIAIDRRPGLLIWSIDGVRDRSDDRAGHRR
ncbi:MAG: hypothetical protein R2710_15830 [Acidimicrobiales bacterium]